jgi:hypothetical protein
VFICGRYVTTSVYATAFGIGLAARRISSTVLTAKR